MGCSPSSQASNKADSAATSDSAFAMLQQRGESAMGVSQYTSQHVFEPLPNGGRIVLQRNAVPGTAEMKRLRADITYTPRDLPGGAEVLIATKNPDAVQAVHDFLAFQRMDHRAGMH